MKKIEIKTQADLNALADDITAEINITGNIERIDRAFPNAEVNVYGNATIRYVYGNATISNVYGNATISNVSENATISNVSENATISNVYGNATISNVYGNATIRYVSENATIRYVSENATIRYVYGNATISNVYGNATISNVYGNATIQTQGKNIVSYYKTSEATVKLDLGRNTTVVVIDPFVPTWEGYTDMYPVTVKEGIATTYKAVHKKEDGTYTAHHDREYIYKIGEKHTFDHPIDNEESCTPGLHVSHLYWAVTFGNDWPDLAIIECAVPIDKIIVCPDCDGKVKTSELTVIRELDKKEYE